VGLGLTMTEPLELQKCDNPEVEHPGFECAHQVRVPNPLDFCTGCGKEVADFDPEGFETVTGQRGHYAHVKTVRWDRVHDREADIYCPPEDTELWLV
jgi:hypothetical protein